MVQIADSVDPWSHCAPFLQAALDRDPTHTLEQVRLLCLSDPLHFQFWPGLQAACVTQIVDSPNMRDLHIWLAGGDWDELRAGLPSIDAFARSMRCDRVTTYARKGFERALAPHGYRLQFVALAKDLRHEFIQGHQRADEWHHHHVN